MGAQICGDSEFVDGDFVAPGKPYIPSTLLLPSSFFPPSLPPLLPS
jgi:hypothetical protein